MSFYLVLKLVLFSIGCILSVVFLVESFSKKQSKKEKAKWILVSAFLILSLYETIEKML